MFGKAELCWSALQTSPFQQIKSESVLLSGVTRGKAGMSDKRRELRVIWFCYDHFNQWFSETSCIFLHCTLPVVNHHSSGISEAEVIYFLEPEWTDRDLHISSTKWIWIRSLPLYILHLLRQNLKPWSGFYTCIYHIILHLLWSH